jgi:hypothetical protein
MSSTVQHNVDAPLGLCALGLTACVYATGLARLGFRPEEDFMNLVVDACMARGFEDFASQELPPVIEGEQQSCERGQRFDCGLIGEAL